LLQLKNKGLAENTLKNYDYRLTRMARDVDLILIKCWSG
jgi:hypothetical protein